MDNSCEPCLPVRDGDNTNPAGITNPNTPVGGVDGTIPAPIPPTAPGPVDPGTRIDQSPPNYDGGFPQQDLTSYASMCDVIPTINMMQGLIMSIIANHFSYATNIIDPTLRSYTWNPDPALSRIVINVEEDWDPQITDVRPAIYLTRTAMKVMKLSINDEQHGGRLSGIQKFSVLVEGGHEIICRGKGGAMTDNLTFEVAMLITRVAPIIRVWLKLNQFRVTDIGAKQTEDDPQVAYVTRTQVPWAFWYHWEISPGAALLEFVDLKYFR